MKNSLNVFLSSIETAKSGKILWVGGNAAILRQACHRLLPTCERPPIRSPCLALPKPKSTISVLIVAGA